MSRTGTKKCSRCGEVKPRTAFHRNASRYDGLHPTCKQCRASAEERAKAAARAARWRADPANLARQRDGQRDRVYGLRPGEYAAQLELQGGTCAICQGQNPHRSIVVDHCHDTGTLRGLLCDACNMGIGGLRDDPALLQRAINYLQSPPWGKLST
jgi:hypothetical protein